MSGLGIIDEEALNIFTDGSSFPLKKQAAGVGVRLVWVNAQGDEEYEDFSPPGWSSATIDEMEIKAVTVGLMEAQLLFEDLRRFKRILVFSDADYVVSNFSKAMNVWPNRAWRGANDMPVENIDLWKELRKQVRNCPVRVDVEWVKSHKSNTHNVAADKLARKSAELPVNRPLSIRETARKWSDRPTRRGCIPVNGQTLKIRIISREYLAPAKTTKYRYEVIDANDASFKDVDFAYCEAHLSRHMCYEVRLNKDQTAPTFIEIIRELDSAEYKYT